MPPHQVYKLYESFWTGAAENFGLMLFFLFLAGLGGYGILRWFKTQLSHSLWTIFYSLTLGLVLFTSCIGIYKTGGISIQWGMLVFAGVALWFMPKAVNLPHFSWQSMAWTVFIFVLVFMGSCWEKFPTQFFPYPGYMGDYIYYSLIAEGIFHSGQENLFGNANFLDVAYQGTTPYHYFDLWLTAGIAEIFHLPYVLVMETWVWPIFRGLVVLGALAFLKDKIPSLSMGWLVLIALGVVFCQGLYVPFFDFSAILKTNTKLVQSLWDARKVAATMVFVLSAVSTFDKKNLTPSVCWLLVAGCTSIGVFPGVWMAIGVLFFNQTVFSSFKTNRLAWLWPLLSVVGLVILYGFLGNKTSEISYAKVLQHAIEQPLTKVKFLISYVFSLSLYDGVLLLVLAFLAFKHWKQWKIETLTIAAFTLGGLLPAALFTGEFQDGDQFLMNIHVMVRAVLWLFVLILVFQNLPKSMGYGVIFLWVLASGIHAYHSVKQEIANTFFWKNNFSPSYVQRVGNHLAQLRPSIGLGFYNQVPDPFYHKKYYIYSPLGFHQSTVIQGFNTVAANMDWVCEHCTGVKFLCQRDQYYFYAFWKKNQGKDRDSTLQAWIKEKKSTYIFMEKNAVYPDWIHAVYEKMEEDPLSGETFWMLKTSTGNNFHTPEQ